MLKEEWYNQNANSNSLQNYQHFDADKDKEDLEGDDEEYPSRHKREDMKEAKLTKDDLIHKVLDGALLDPKSGQNQASVDGILHYIKKAGVKGVTKGDIIKHAKTMAGLKIQGGNILKDIKEETMNEGKVLKEYTDKNFNKDSIAGFKPDLKVLKKFFPKSVRSSKEAYKRFTKYEGGEMWVHVAYTKFKHNYQNLSLHWKEFYYQKEPVNLTLMWFRNRDTDTNYGALLVDTDTFYKEKKQYHGTNEMKEAKKSTQMKQFDKKMDAKLIANRMRNNKSKSAKSFQLKAFADKVSKMGKVSERDIDNLLPDYIPGGLIASLFTESVNEIKNKFDIQKTFGKDVHAIKKTKEGNFIVQGNLDKIRKTAEKNNINIEDVENWGVRIWTESVNEGKESEVKKKTIKALEDWYNKSSSSPSLFDLAKISNMKTAHLQSVLKTNKTAQSAMKALWSESVNEVKETVDKNAVKMYVQKYKDKMKGSSHSTKTDWVDGIGGISKETKSEILKKLKNESVNEATKKNVSAAVDALAFITDQMKRHAGFYTKAKKAKDAKEMSKHLMHLKAFTKQKKQLEKALDDAISGLDKDVELVANEHVVRSQIRNIVRETLKL